MSSQLNKAAKAAKSAEEDLVEAEVMAGRQNLYGAKQMARAMKREAKRRKAKARRRQARQICDHPDLLDDYEDYEDYEDYSF